MKTVYLAGKITGDPLYALKFFDAARALEAAGFAVMNPAVLPPEGFAYGAYIRVTTAMLDECETACFLPDWEESAGARYEHSRATEHGKEIIFFDEWKAGLENAE